MENQTNDNLDRPLTLRHFQEFVEKAFGKFASKDDLNRFASKDDLNRFASKDDLERFQCEMKQDFHDFGERVFKTFATKEDIKEIERRIIEKTTFERDKVLTSNDKAVKRVSEMAEEFKMKSSSDLRRDEEIENHEKRIVHIETQLNLAPAGS